MADGKLNVALVIGKDENIRNQVLLPLSTMLWMLPQGPYNSRRLSRTGRGFLAGTIRNCDNDAHLSA